MHHSERQNIREIVKNLENEALRLHADLVAIPANPQTTEGYTETVDYIAAALSDTADTVAKIDVPNSYLHECWGENLENAKDYLNVEEFAPRRIATAQLNGASAEIGLHFTNNYDLYWGPKKERAGTVAQIMAMMALKKSGVSLKKSIFLSATPDAYIGGESGAGYVAAADIGRSKYVIAGGLSGPNLITVGYKGMIWAKLAIRGKAAHGARAHEGRNAIEAMMWVQNRILEMSKQYATRLSAVPIRPVEASAPSITMCRIAGNLDSGFVAPDCALFIDRRLNPGETVAQVRQELETLAAEARQQTGFEISLSMPHTVEPSYTSPESTLYQTLANNLHDVSGKPAEPVVWSHYLGMHYFTEAWDSQVISYNPGAIGHNKVVVEPEDDVFDASLLLPTIEALALTAYDQINRDSDIE